LPHDEGNNMTVRAWPRVRAHCVALAVAGTVAGTLCATHAQAQPVRRGEPEGHPHRRYVPSSQMPRAGLASSAAVPILRTGVPPDIEDHQRDGHMTPEERRLLRQHIEDAVRELYKR
jgi:hypothetical protein